ncbi:MAG: hypothetical protein Q8O64_06705 [Sideroxyarcus sp.]|nr:hypothetical protein [Sideroxyarcus sp.]
MIAGELGQSYVIRPSRMLTVFLVVSAALLVLLISNLPLAAGWRLAGAVWVLSTAGFVLLRDAWLRTARSCVAFDLAPQQRITLIPHNGEPVAGSMDESSFVSPYLTLVNITTDSGKRRSLVIMPDSMGEADFRRLRVQLRWSGQA